MFVCVCVSVCVCVTKTMFVYTLTSQISLQKRHILLAYPLYMTPIWRQRCLLDLLSHTESAISLIAIHTIIPQGSPGIFQNITVKTSPILEIATSIVWLDRLGYDNTGKANPMCQCTKISVLCALSVQQSADRGQAACTGYVFCETLVYYCLSGHLTLYIIDL